MKTSYIISFKNCETYFKSFWDKFTEFPFEDGQIVFVDRGSTDASLQLVEESYALYRKRLGKFRDLALVVVPYEIGHNEVAMLNKGIKVSTGEVIHLLEARIEVIFDWYSSMMSSMQRENADIGGPYMNDTNVHQSSSKLLNDINTDIDRLKTFSHFYDFIHSAFLERAKSVPYIESSCMFIKRRVFDDIGYFDDRFSNQQIADVDLCYRAGKAGLKIIVCQDVLVMKTSQEDAENIADHSANIFEVDIKNLSKKFIQEYGLSNDDEVQKVLKEMDQ